MATTVINNLFPPIFNHAFMPAFIYTTECRIYFAMSQYNSTSDLKKIAPVQIIVQSQKTNKTALKSDQNHYPSGIKLSTYEIDNERSGPDKYYVTITADDLQNGFELNAYYKVQLRFTGVGASNPPSGSGIDNWLNSNLQYFSEWSQVVLIRGISRPVITLTGLPSSGVSNFRFPEVPISGTVTFENRNDTEKLQSYQVFLYTQSGYSLLETSDMIYVNMDNYTNEIKYNLKTELQVGSIYVLKIQIVTSNLYTFAQDELYSVKFKIVANDETKLNVGLFCEGDINTGSAKITLINKYFHKTESANKHKLVKNIKFVIKRASNLTDFSVWDEIDNFTIKEDELYSLVWYDYSTEPGIWYRYHIIRYNANNVRTSSIKTTQPIMIDPEDIFLVAEGKELIIRFNPQVSNFAIKTAESITQTIGSQYPFMRRNGNVYYKTFSLSGTIASFTNLKTNSFKASKQDLYGDYKSYYDNYNKKYNIDAYHDYVYERYFRDAVIEFLYKNTVKLYKSATEGNILIKLNNITLTPNTSLNRLIYDFTCSASQVAEYSLENCKKYNVLPQGEYIACEELIS